MKNIILTVAVVVAASLASCNYLNIDNYFGDELQIDSVFQSKRYMEAYMWSTAAQFPDEGRDLMEGGATPGPLATDEAFTAFSESATVDLGGNNRVDAYPGLKYVLGRYSATGSGHIDQWEPMYRILRRCNTMLAHIGETRGLTPTELSRDRAYIRFMRAYAYYRLAVDYGPVILIGDEVINNSATLEEYDRARATFDETVNYICDELEAIAEYLPLKHGPMDIGRPTQGAALGLVARLRLIHASPLYNGGEAAKQSFGRWTRTTDGAYYVQQTYDERRWAVAAAACKKVMDLGIYDLYTVKTIPAWRPKPLPYANEPEKQSRITDIDPDYYRTWEEGGVAGIDHFKSYSDVFTGEAVLQVNPEMVWGRNSDGLTASTTTAHPRSDNGGNSMGVTQKVIDAYYMFDGRDMYNSSDEYRYSETGLTTMTENFSSYLLNANVDSMYVNREMRFYASIGYHNRYWQFLSCSGTNGSVRTISYFRESDNGRRVNPFNYSPTGYVVTKFIHEEDAIKGDNARKVTPKVFGMIRYAEILLSYAEALNNLTQAHTITSANGETQTFARNTDEMRQAFAKVRHRAGLPAPAAAELADRNVMQQLLERERMIEFLFENRRYYDVRRWGKYESSEYEPIIGMNTDGNDDLSYYHRTVPSTPYVQQRMVDKKLLLLPIPLDEVRRLPSLDQNPGWEK